MEFSRVALAYLAMGRPVIPLCPPNHGGMPSGHLRRCAKPGKTPLISGWQRYGEVLPTRAEVEAWARRWPGANVGGPTGPLWGIALDIDPRHGGNLELEVRGWKVPDTPTSLMGGGGRHHLFAHPGFRVLNKVALAPGVDLRGDGGQIVLPPSLHMSGRVYHWEHSLRPEKTPLAPMPSWLLEAVRGDGAFSRRGDAAQGRLAGVEGVEQGRRDATGYRLACRWLVKGLDPREVEELLVAWAARCRPPMGQSAGDLPAEEWARVKVRSALKAFEQGKLQRLPRKGGHGLVVTRVSL